ncbi:ABC transporter substrate-binding protein [soil metagenome]
MLAASLAVTSVLIVTGCSSTASTATSASPSAAGLPAALQGDLVNPVYIYPPYGFVGDDGKLTGLYPEVSDQLGTELGVSITNKEEAFENTLTGVQSGKYIWLTGGEITAERLQAFDWSLVNTTFATFLALQKSPDLGKDEAGLCGFTIAAVSGSTQATALATISDSCTAKGLKPISVGQYKDFTALVLALQSGQADLAAGDYVSEKDVIAKDATLKMTGPQITRNLVGIATKKGSGLAQTVSDAINAMIADGTYAKLFTKYGIQDLMIEKSTVNPQPSGS